MENCDLEIIKRHMGEDKTLETLYHEHLDYEKMLEKFNNKNYLTPSEELERKNIQKLKLLGRDKIEAILRKYRKG
jgi:hypothetical protein